MAYLVLDIETAPLPPIDNGMGFDIPFLTTRVAYYSIVITNRKFINLFVGSLLIIILI